MSSEFEHPIYQYTIEEKQKIQNEIGLTEKTVEESVDAILDWFQKQPHLAEAYICREYVERALVVSKGSIEKTKQRIDSYYKCRASAPDIIQNREMYIRELSPAKNNWAVIPMKKLHDCRRIVYTRVSKQSNEGIDFESFFKFSCLNGDIRMQYDYMLGDIWVIDWKNVTISQLITVNPVNLRKSDKIIQSLGWRVVSIHMINAIFSATMGNSFISGLSQFFNAKLMSKIVIHDNPDELNKFISKDLLPKDYGGDAPSLDELEEELLSYYRSDKVVEIATRASDMVSNETKRPGYVKDDENLAGSFRKLQVD